jgi:acetate kinase
VLLHLVGQRGTMPAALEKRLYKEPGLLGRSGISNDMGLLLESSEPRARLAIDYFAYYVAKEIGALAAVLGGLDGLVFTAGIGENSPAIRTSILAACEWLGVRLDVEANQRRGLCISAAGSAASALVVPPNEGLMFARHTQRLAAQISP